MIDIAGSGLVQLTRQPGGNGSPAWSPDGSRIVFSSGRDHSSNIFVMNANGSGAVNLTRHPADDLFPAWSSNGRIAFSSDRDGNLEIYNSMRAPR